MDDLLGAHYCLKCGDRFRKMKDIVLCPKCGCPNCATEYRIGIWNFPCNGSGDHKLGTFYTRDPNIHSSERVKLLYNPTTGETRTPGRVDRDIHPKYVASGFTQYKELETHQEIRQLEKEKGLRHEMSNFDMGSGHAD